MKTTVLESMRTLSYFRLDTLTLVLRMLPTVSVYVRPPSGNFGS